MPEGSSSFPCSPSPPPSLLVLFVCSFTPSFSTFLLQHSLVSSGNWWRGADCLLPSQGAFPQRARWPSWIPLCPQLITINQYEGSNTTFEPKFFMTAWRGATFAGFLLTSSHPITSLLRPPLIEQEVWIEDTCYWHPFWIQIICRINSCISESL